MCEGPHMAKIKIKNVLQISIPSEIKMKNWTKILIITRNKNLFGLIRRRIT